MPGERSASIDDTECTDLDLRRSRSYACASGGWKRYVRFVVSPHARAEAARRQIPEHLLDQVLKAPQQIVPERQGRKAYQSQLEFGEGKIFLLRAIVIDTVDPAIVVTVYRTSKIGKYWSIA